MLFFLDLYFSRLKALEVVRCQIWEQLKEVCISAWIHASHMKRAPELPELQYLGLLTTLPVKRLVFGGLIIDGLLLRLCNETLKSPKTPDTRYLVPGLSRWWACSTALMPCVSTLVFDDTKDYCVLVQLVWVWQAPNSLLTRTYFSDTSSNPGPWSSCRCWDRYCCPNTGPSLL